MNETGETTTDRRPCLLKGIDPDTGLDIYERGRKNGIVPSPEFAKKKLATHAVNVGFKCGNACAYCSASANIRTHNVFKEIGRTAFEIGYAIVDPDIHDRVQQDLGRVTAESVVQVCTLSDAYAPEARRLNLGRKCIEPILRNTKATVRVLTKNAEVRDDFDLFEEYPDRVLVGISITGLPEHEHALRIIEPNASSITERRAAMEEAHRRGLRTYAMFCPVFPGLFATPEQIHQLVEWAGDIGAEEIWTEIPNPRGPGLKRCAEAWRAAGFTDYANAVDAIRHSDGRSAHGIWLTQNMQSAARDVGFINRLHVLNYRGSFAAQARDRINQDCEGVIWLGN
jgi:DNA repair photolyase